MNAPRTRSERLLEQMAHGVVPVADSKRQQAMEEHIVPRLEELHAKVIAERGRRLRLRPAWLLACAAALMLGVVGAWYLTRGSSGREIAQAGLRTAKLARLAKSTGSVTVDTGHATQGADLVDGQRVRTDDGARALVRFERGATVALGPRTSISLVNAFDGDPSDQGVSLFGGRLVAHIPHLTHGEHFSVHTPDTVVQVHGTRFSVEVSGHPLESRVRVTEGRVLVRHAGVEVFLDAGAAWSSRTGVERAPRAQAPRTTTSAAATPSVDSSVSSRPAASAHPGPSAAGLAPKAVPASSRGSASSTTTSGLEASRGNDALAAQNALMERAMRSRRNDDGRALSLLEQLLTRYPHSPLIETALVERFRALDRLGRHEQAADAARRYLARYPNGFARAEARALALRLDDGSH